MKTALHFETGCIFGSVAEHFEGDYQNSEDDFSVILVTLSPIIGGPTGFNTGNRSIPYAVQDISY